MRLIRFAVAASLSLGSSGYAGTALAGSSNPRLDGEFSVEDPHDPIDHNNAFIEIAGSNVFARGEVESHNGTMTNGVPDTVFIEWQTDKPNHIKVGEFSAHIHQHNFSQLRVVINSDTPARNLDTGPVNPEKCEIDANIDVKDSQGNIHSTCTVTDVFSGLTADQVASILAAFDGNKHVVVKVNGKGKATLKIKTFGPVVAAPL